MDEILWVRKKPADVPASPEWIYSSQGWIGMSDWLGNGRTNRGQYRPFKKARAFVRDLSLKSADGWRAYCMSGKRPADIPSNPNTAYANSGWAGFGDWVGTGTVATHLRDYRSFEKARAFVRGLGLKSTNEWYEYRRSGKKPADVPAAPHRVYSDQGWAGMRDWLGNGRVAPD